MKMIFLGAPGVGKGTHAGLIAKLYSIPKISTGDLFREEVKKGTELGKRIEGILNAGELVPDEIVIEVLKKRISQEDCKNGYILDGFPRTIPQAEALDKITKIDLVVNLVASEQTIIDRITNRYTCRNCGEVYNIKFVPPKREGICDKCGGELYQREDQKPEVVKERLRVYEEKTKPLIEYYKNKGILLEVNVEGEVNEVHERIANAIKKWLEEHGKQA